MDGLLLIVTFFLAFWLGRKSVTTVSDVREQRPFPPPAPPVAWTREHTIRRVLKELRRSPFTDIVSPEERGALVSRYYGMLADIDAEQAPPAITPAPQPAATLDAGMEERLALARSFAEKLRQEATRPSPGPAPTQIERAPIPVSVPMQIERKPAPVTSPAPITPPKPAPRPPRQLPRFEPKLDPAVMLLYLGALLVVAAGLIYASYAWSDLGPWQKLGLLMGATAAFIATGLLLWRKPRVTQAGETFLAVGAHLAWWTGDGALAGDAVERALRVDPGHRLAALIGSACEQGIPPRTLAVPA